MTTTEPLATPAGLVDLDLFDQIQLRATLHETLGRAAAELGSLGDAAALVNKLVETYTALLQPQSCAVALLWSGDDRLTTLASSAPSLPRTIPLTEIPEAILAHVTERWTDVTCPVELGPQPWLSEVLGSPDARYLLLPLIVEEQPQGAVVLGFGEHRHLSDEELQAASTLTTVASVALDRQRLLAQRSRQVSRLSALYQLSAALTEGICSDQAVTMLNELLAEQGLHIVDVSLEDDRLARQLRPLAERADSQAAASVDTRGTVAVPMRLGRRVVGSLHVRPGTGDNDEGSFLDALASGLAEILHRGALRAAAEESARERAVAAERERIAADLHDDAAQLFVAISLVTQRLAEKLPASAAPEIERVIGMADQGKSAVQEAVRGLTFFPVRQRGLVASLESLAQSVAAAADLSVTVEVAGSQARLAPPVEYALYRVAHEALVNAWRHSRCRTVRVELLFRSSDAVLRVGDDGVGLGEGADVEPDGFGAKGLRRAISEVGGELRFSNRWPRGLVVEARVPSTL